MKNRSNIAASILQNPDMLKSVYDTANNSDGSAQEELDKYMNSIEGHLNTLTTKWQEFWAESIQTDFVNGIIDISAGFLDFINNIGGAKGALLQLIPILMQIKGISPFAYNKDASGIGQILNWGNKSGNGINKELLEQFDMISVKFNEAFKKGDATTLDAIKNGIGGIDSSVTSYAKTCTNAEMTQEGFVQSLTATNTASKATTIGVNMLKAASMTLISVLGNMILMFAATKIIEVVVKSFDDWHVSAEEAKESLSTLSSEMKSIESNFKDTEGTVEDLKDRFSELSEGIDMNTNKNLTLSTKDYQEFLELNSQIAQIFPEVVTGLDSEGNAILNLGSNAKEVKGSIEDLIQAKKDLSTYEMSELYSGTFKASKSIVKSSDTKLSIKDDVIGTMQWLKNYIEENDGIMNYTELYHEGADILNTFLTETGSDIFDFAVEPETNMYKVDMSKFNALYAKALSNLQNQKLVASTTKKSAMSSLLKPLLSKLSYDDLYAQLSDEYKSFVSDVISNMDIKDYDDDGSDFMNELLMNILAPLNSDEELKSSLDEILKLDEQAVSMSLYDYTARMQNLLNSVSDEYAPFKNQLLKVYDTSEETALIDHAASNLSVAKNVDPKFVQELDEEELVILCKLTIDPGDTKQDLENKIAEYKESVEDEPIYITLKSVYKDETASSALDDFQSNINKIKDSISKLDSGEFSIDELFSLSREFDLDLSKIDLSTFEGLKEQLENLPQKELSSVLDTVNSLGEFKSPEEYEIFSKMLQGIADSALEQDLKKISEELSKLTNNANLVKQANEEASKYGKIYGSTLQQIASAYPQLETYVAKYQQGLITEKELFYQLELAYNQNQSDYTSLLQTKLENDTTFYNDLLKNNEQYYNQVRKYYGDDYQNWTNVADAKYGIEKELMSQLAGEWNKYFTAIYDEQSGLYELAPKEGFDEYDVQNVDWTEKQKKQMEIPKRVSQQLINIANDTTRSLEIPLKLEDFSWEKISSGDSPDSEKKDTEKDTTETIDFITKKIKLMEDELSKAQDKADDISLIFGQQNKALQDGIDLIKTQKTEYEKIKNYYNTKADNIGLDDKLKSKIKNGSIQIKDYDSETAKKIQKYQEYIEAAEEMQNKLDELDETSEENGDKKNENIEDKYSVRIGVHEASYSLMEKELEYEKSQGTLSEEDYTNLIAKQAKLKEIHQEYLTYKTSELAGMTKYSEEWYAAKNEIIETQEAILECDENTQELIKTQGQLKWDKWEKFYKILDDINGIANDYNSLIDDDDAFDANLKLTDAGKTKILLYSTQMEIYRKQIEETKQAISLLKEQLASGEKTQEEYNEELATQNSTMLELANSIKSTSDAQKDLIINNAIEQIEKETEARKELIDTTKEQIEKEYELYQKQKEQSKQSSELANMQSKAAQLKIASDNGDLKARAEYMDLQKDISDKLEEIETQNTEDIKDAKLDALDKELENFEKLQDEKTKELQESSDKQKQIVDATLESVKSSFGASLTYLEGISSNFNITLSDYLTSPWEKAEKKAESSSKNIAKILKESFASMYKLEDDYDDQLKDSVKNKIKKIIQNGTGKGGLGSTLNKYVAENYGDGKYLSYEQMAALTKLLPMQEYTTDQIKSDKTQQIRNEILENLKIQNFSSTGIVSTVSGALNDIVRRNGDDALVSVQNKEVIIKDYQYESMIKLANKIDVADSMIDKIYKNNNPNKMTELASNNSNTAETIYIDSLIKADGNIYDTSNLTKMMESTMKDKAKSLLGDIIGSRRK